MEGFQIKNQCAEKWGEMTPDEKGAFCSKCSKSVHDFSKKSLGEIKVELLRNKGAEMCGRIQQSHQVELNRAFLNWEMSSRKNINRAMLFSLLVVFGLSIVSCTNEEQKLVIKDFQTQATAILAKEQKQIPEVTEIIIERKKLEYIPTLTSNIVEIEDSILNKDTLHAETDQFFVFDDVEMGGVMMGLVSVSQNYYSFLEDTVSAVVDEYDVDGRLLPNEFSALLFPNPASSELNIKLEIGERKSIVIQLFSQQGEFIQEIENKEFERGTYTVPVNIIDQSTGVYLVVIHSASYNKTLRFVKQ